ncbi:type II toxin-antitoxin system Phd/YefM family antitoxin [Micromonospora sp. DT15]|uniref:type II toxin-antitoxin system Phd/YefM family antitoxin n=1 Tax=Micromonospora sp. DT15 TaxID=3393445 RepID=UPI003CF90D51
MNTAPLTEVRDNLREVVDTVVETGTEFIITRHGKPVAVVLGYDEYESLVETLNILSDDDTMASIREGEAELAEGE